MFENYIQAESYLNEGLIRVNVPDRPNKLTRREWMLKFLDDLGHPERAFPAIHIAGTSGKGSTATLLSRGTWKKEHPRFSPDGRWIWFLCKGKLYRLAVQGGSTEEIPFHAETDSDFHTEKIAVFNEAWRLLRDHFYDARFRGLDWLAVRRRFLPLVKGLHTRRDLAVIEAAAGMFREVATFDEAGVPGKAPF